MRDHGDFASLIAPSLLLVLLLAESGTTSDDEILVGAQAIIVLRPLLAIITIVEHKFRVDLVGLDSLEPLARSLSLALVILSLFRLAVVADYSGRDSRSFSVGFTLLGYALLVFILSFGGGRLGRLLFVVRGIFVRGAA